MLKNQFPNNMSAKLAPRSARVASHYQMPQKSLYNEKLNYTVVAALYAPMVEVQVQSQYIYSSLMAQAAGLVSGKGVFRFIER